MPRRRRLRAATALRATGRAPSASDRGPGVASHVRRLLCVVAVAAALSASAEAQAGVTSLARTVAMSATKASALSVSIVSGASQTMTNLTDNAINTFATPVRVTTAWTVSRSATSEVRLLAYFSTPAQALASGTNFIAATQVRGRVLTTPVTTWQPTAWTPFTQNGSRGVGVNAATLRLFRIPITAANATGSRTFDLELQIDLTGQPALTAGTYTGSITIRAFTT